MFLRSIFHSMRISLPLSVLLILVYYVVYFTHCLLALCSCLEIRCFNFSKIKILKFILKWSCVNSGKHLLSAIGLLVSPEA